ncbi:MAG: glycosyltransferase [Candidatus Bathyarchaeota archaeon]|nr:glycosyltransferase [Candidatus Bathyarchaeota archaeon]
MSDASGKSAIITVTYNKVPDFSCFEAASPMVDYVVICDNSTDKQVTSRLDEYCRCHPQFVLIKNHENLGISKAYNKAVSYAAALGAYWLYFFDDDAHFDAEWLIKAQAAWRWLEASGVPVGLLVPIISNDEKYVNSNLGIKTPYSVISWGITSGFFTTTSVFNRCGGYDPAYFVDWADLEFNRRIRNGGYLVVRLNEVLIHQDFGRSLSGGFLSRIINAAVKSYSLISLKLNKSNTFTTAYSLYSPSRYRSLSDNGVWSLRQAGMGDSRFRLLMILFQHVFLSRVLRREILYPTRS